MGRKKKKRRLQLQPTAQRIFRPWGPEGAHLEVAEDINVGPGGRVWDGAQILAGFLATNAGTLVRGKRILELGAGTGLPGLVCALSGAQTGKQSCICTPLSPQFYTSIAVTLNLPLTNPPSWLLRPILSGGA